jgi:hypothetical protein
MQVWEKIWEIICPFCSHRCIDKPKVWSPAIAARREGFMAHSYRCADFPGMESCPGSFQSDTKAELWKHIELHAKIAHQEDPQKWTAEERQQMENVIR